MDTDLNNQYQCNLQFFSPFCRIRCLFLPFLPHLCAFPPLFAIASCGCHSCISALTCAMLSTSLLAREIETPTRSWAGTIAAMALTTATAQMRSTHMHGGCEWIVWEKSYYCVSFQWEQGRTNDLSFFFFSQAFVIYYLGYSIVPPPPRPPRPLQLLVSPR